MSHIKAYLEHEANRIEKELEKEKLDYFYHYLCFLGFKKDEIQVIQSIKPCNIVPNLQTYECMCFKCGFYRGCKVRTKLYKYLKFNEIIRKNEIEKLTIIKVEIPFYDKVALVRIRCLKLLEVRQTKGLEILCKAVNELYGDSVRRDK